MLSSMNINEEVDSAEKQHQTICITEMDRFENQNASSKQEYGALRASNEYVLADNSQNYSHINNSLITDQSPKPQKQNKDQYLTPWRQNGKVGLFQNGLKQSITGINHGMYTASSTKLVALTRSQASNQQLPQIVNPTYASRLTMKILNSKNTSQNQIRLSSRD